VPFRCIFKISGEGCKNCIVGGGGGGGFSFKWLCHHCIASVTRGYYTMI